MTVFKITVAAAIVIFCQSGVIIANAPPENGRPATKAQQLGQDRNKNGVWDDVEPTLRKLAGGSAKTQAALTQLTKSWQSFMESADNEGTPGGFFRDLNCLRFVRPDDWDALSQKLRRELINTNSRSEAYRKAESKLDGSSYRLPQPQTLKLECDFDVDKLR